MSSDYFPSSLQNLQTWLSGIKTGITTDAAACGQTPGQITSDTALVDSLLGVVTIANTKEVESLDAHGAARGALRQKRNDLRDMINRYKNSTGWTEGMTDSWQVSSRAATYDMNTQKPRITARSIPGFVIISGSKPGFSSLTIQKRLNGESNWVDIGIKVNHLPFYDTTAAQNADKPEKREYRGIGYKGDQQVGQPSDIVTAVFTG